MIRAAALRLIDADGLEAFSTRKLGKELGCEAMAIYWYFASKDALLDAVVDELMAEVGALVTDRAPEDWVGALRAVAHAYRGVAQAHPRAFPLLATRRFGSEATFAFLERLFTLARERGIDDRTAARFYRVVSAYCNGFALNELAAPRGALPGGAAPAPRGKPRRAPTPAHVRAADARDLASAAQRARFPRVEAVSAWLAPRHADENFAFGLELQLAALARAVPEGA